ncbi:MAG: tetraacyldisaccharide 4'-kinase [Desulfobacterales bacterium]|nr:tetraacyldisaccharide 4'-kinase [Desulfobacterales bacterium]
MEKRLLRNKLQDVLLGDGPGGFSFFRSGLFLISQITGGAARLRAAAYEHRIFKPEKLACTVISVGNISVGGTGKTPMTIYLAGLLKDLGYAVAIISRGYKGGAEKRGGVVSDGLAIRMTPADAGDEPFLMAAQLRNVPVLVGKNRYASGRLALDRFKPDVILLDDAFQHLQLARDVNLVLMDYQRPYGNSHLFPRGSLREPITALARGDAFIFTRSVSGPPDPVKQLPRHCRGKPVFNTSHIPYLSRRVGGPEDVPAEKARASAGSDFAFLKDRRVYAFSGIAKNRDFKATVESLSCCLRGFAEFSDHHNYTERDLGNIFAGAQRAGAEFLLTTDKDFVRIPPGVIWPVDLVVIGVKISFQEDEARFRDFIKQKLLTVS